MTKCPFDITGLTAEVIDQFYNTWASLSARFRLDVPGYINFHLDQFEVFKQYTGFRVLGTFVIKHLNCDSYVFFIETHTKTMVKGIMTNHVGYQVWGLAYVKHDFGRVLIRRETLSDKIVELVHPVELDFAEDKPFSDTFYVLVNDRQKAVNAIDRNFRNAVMDVRVDDFAIEVLDHTLIIGDRRPVSPEKAVHIAEFVTRLSSMC